MAEVVQDEISASAVQMMNVYFSIFLVVFMVNIVFVVLVLILDSCC